MGTNIQAWRQRVPNNEIRLSQLLSMYYSEDGAFEPRFRACERRGLYSEVAPNNELIDQVRHCSARSLKGKTCMKNV